LLRYFSLALSRVSVGEGGQGRKEEVVNRWCGVIAWQGAMRRTQDVSFHEGASALPALSARRNAVHAWGVS
jgi:hypothetical protein